MSIKKAKRPPLIDKRDPAFLVQPVDRLEPKPETQFRSRKHLEFVARQPCRACGRTMFVAAAHLWKGTDGFKPEKPSDIYCNPLCDTSKSMGKSPSGPIYGCHDKQHSQGEITFWTQLVGIGVVAAKLEALNLALRSDCPRARAAAEEALNEMRSPSPSEA
ncbi:hypothetical protein J2847_005812 [Azospirillum agricola]|uniref:hypothetical protein n=1 Tax=Azospirillum agricola TaxID=1720247 RepID=UPI001AE3BD4A|nr:hypothetical protein [Azospirillum agricola]MBP2232483.1 hypothetical protein [Azospirillum agricola]